MALVMKWDGLNLPAQNITTSLAGPGDLAPNYLSPGPAHAKWYKSPATGIMTMERGGAGMDQRSAIAWGALGSRGAGNLNSREFQAAFYVRMARKNYSDNKYGPIFFRAYDPNGQWLATLRIDSNNVVLTDDTGNRAVVLSKYSNTELAGQWTRFEISFNRRQGKIAARVGTGSWVNITMNSTMKARPRLDRIALGMYEYFGPSWVQFRNLRVHDDSYPIPAYVAPSAPKVSVGSTVSINEGGTANLTSTVTVGGASIDSRLWNRVQLGSWSSGDGTLSMPAGASIANPLSANTAVTGLPEGEYRFRMRVRDSNNYEVDAFQSVVVGEADSPPEISHIESPVIFAGQYAIVSATISSWGNHGATEGDMLWMWGKAETTAVIANPWSATTSIGPFTTPGEFVYVFGVSNNRNQYVEREVTITVTDAEPPVVAYTSHAIDDLEPILYDVISHTTVAISATITQGSLPIGSRQWIAVPPESAVFDDPTSLSTNVTFLEGSYYGVGLQVMDTMGNTSAQEYISFLVTPANPPVVSLPNDYVVNVLLYPIVEIIGIFHEGDNPIVSKVWTVEESPNNVGATVSSDEDSAWITDFIELGAYTIRCTVTDSSGQSGWDEIVLFILDSSRPVDPVKYTDPLDGMSNHQLQLMVAEKMSGRDKAFTYQLSQEFLLSVLTSPDKYKMSYHQLLHEYFKGILNGSVDQTLGQYGEVDGGNAENGQE